MGDEMPSADARYAICLHELVDRSVATRPAAVAVRCGGEQLTYGELGARTDALAAALLDRGVGPAELVGVALAPSLDLVVSVIGIMKAGAAYVAIDPAYPRDRVEFILDDSASRLVFTDDTAGWIADLPQVSPLRVPALSATATGAARALPLVHPRQLCYLIYTSGSTGRPKGAMNNHGGVAGTMRSLAERIGLSADDRVLQTSSLNFDLSVIEIFTALLSGATLVVPTAAERTDPSLIVRLLADEAVTVWSSTPALFRPVTDLAARAGALPAGLRTVLLAGDRFPPSMAATLAELGRDVTAYNVAGMTEVSCCSLVYEVRPSDAARDAMPWGEVLDRHVSYVLDDAQQPVPAGAPGELYIGGAGVGMGYWDRPDLTKERFVPDPFAGGDAVMYKTGDLVRRVTDGGLEFLGRLDGQVKVRGVRVEAGEIESALEQHPQIQQAAVVAREARVGENVLVGYVVPEPGVLLSAAQCREHLLTTVPVHSVPSQFFFLSGLPLSPNGKVDRQALPFPQPGPGPDGSGPDGSGPDGSGPDGARHSPGPVGAQHSVGPPDDQAGALCATVIRMWEEVLGRQHIGAHDSFFDLGGHSLHAMEIVARVRGELAATTRLSDLMDRPTPAAYAAHLEPTVRAPLSSVR